MDTRSLIEESTKPKAHIYWGEGEFRQISGRHWLYSTVRPKNLPGYTTVPIGPNGGFGPPIWVGVLRGKPYQDGQSMGMKPMIFADEKKEVAEEMVNRIATRGWRAVPELRLEEWHALEEIVDSDDEARVVDWPLAGFMVALDETAVRLAYSNRKAREKWEKHVKTYGNDFGAEDEGPPVDGDGGGWIPDCLRGVTETPDVPELERLFKQLVDDATKGGKYDTGNSMGFIELFLDEFRGANLSAKAFNRGYRLDDLGYDGQDNYALMEKLISWLESTFTDPHLSWRGEATGLTQGETMTQHWKAHQKKIRRKRVGKGKNAHMFSYE